MLLCLSRMTFWTEIVGLRLDGSFSVNLHDQRRFF